MDELEKEIEALMKEVLGRMAVLPLETRVRLLNKTRAMLREASPFIEPVDLVTWVETDRIRGNDYNPNTVAPPEMRLLEISIRYDGFTQPIVAYKDDEANEYVVIDGFHRHLVGSKSKDIKEKMHGYLPVVVIHKPLEQRMASTIRHNRARGKHGVAPMSLVVADLSRSGWEDSRIAKELGMDADEVLRLKQRTGIAALFKDREFSQAWVERKGSGPAP